MEISEKSCTFASSKQKNKKSNIKIKKGKKTMSKNKMNKALAANRVVALFSHKDKNGTPRYDIYKMK